MTASKSTKSKGIEISAEKIKDAIEKGACSLTAISKALGYKGSVSGSVAKKIRELVPEIDALIKGKKVTPVKQTPTTKSKPAKKVVAKKAGKTAKEKPSTPKNPYRPGSSYAICFDCLLKMGLANPVSRKDLLLAYAKASGKTEKRANYDLSVVLSPSKDGHGHKSSRKEAYWVERLPNSRVQLHMV